MDTRRCTRAPPRCSAIWPSLAPTAVCAACWRGSAASTCWSIDDWAMAPLAETERRDFWEICEDRYQTRSTILTSQLPVARWHEQIGDPTAADGILDRLVHNAHRIEMRGDSMRKTKTAAPNPKPTILLLPNRSSRNRAAGDKGAQTPPLSPAPQIPALPGKLCSNQLQNLLSNQRLVSVASLRNLSLLIFLDFFLTIPITSYTITSPASLRSDHLIGINRNADRHHAGTLIGFPGIRMSSTRLRAIPLRLGSRHRFLGLLMLDLDVLVLSLSAQEPSSRSSPRSPLFAWSFASPPKWPRIRSSTTHSTRRRFV